MNTLEIIILIITLWTIPWKIYAVWTASRSEHRRWFVVLLLLNTLSILELVYIFYVLKKKWVDVKQDFKDGWKLFKAEFKSKKSEVATPEKPTQA
jgi:hypothetical protein